MMPLDDYGYFMSDEETSFIKAWQVMTDIAREGWVKNIGLSNFNLS